MATRLVAQDCFDDSIETDKPKPSQTFPLKLNWPSPAFFTAFLHQILCIFGWNNRTRCTDSVYTQNKNGFYCILLFISFYNWRRTNKEKNANNFSFTLKIEQLRFSVSAVVRSVIWIKTEPKRKMCNSFCLLRFCCIPDQRSKQLGKASVRKFEWSEMKK